MKKFKHSKYRNTGIIFELLSKQVAIDVLSENENHSLDIIKKYFKEGTELHKELACYQALGSVENKKESMAMKLIDIVLEQKNQIDKKKLNREKYNLIGDIRENYIGDTFFDTRVANYKLYASIYKLLEYNSADNPTGHVKCYDTIIEHMTLSPSDKKNKKESISLYEKQSDDVKKLAFKLLIEKFNEKYKGLSKRQKTLISRFINENTNLTPFKNFVYAEVQQVQKELNELKVKVKDKALKIKLAEVIDLTEEIAAARRIKDEHISSLVKYYELVDYLRAKV